MSAPAAGSFDLESPEMKAFCKQMLQTTFNVQSDKLDDAVKSCFAVVDRLSEHRAGFQRRGASSDQSIALALAEDFSFAAKGCGNPGCKTDKHKLLLQEKLKRCARCLSMLYCSRACQRAHWKVHKHSCLPPQKPE